jgi:hypothetical protein
MRNRKIWGILVLALLVVAPAAQASSNEFEFDLGWYFPSNIELEGLHTTLEYHDNYSYGLRYGHRFDQPWGLGVSWSHVDLDSASSDANRIGCSTCDFDVDFADFSFEWYPGNHDWALYAGLGWATGEFEINRTGVSNDFKISDDAFTYHLGAAYSWQIGSSFYIRPDARVRFLQLDQSGRGKYDSEDPEFRLGLGWRF